MPNHNLEWLGFWTNLCPAGSNWLQKSVIGGKEESVFFRREGFHLIDREEATPPVDIHPQDGVPHHDGQQISVDLDSLNVIMLAPSGILAVQLIDLITDC